MKKAFTKFLNNNNVQLSFALSSLGVCLINAFNSIKGSYDLSEKNNFLYINISFFLGITLATFIMYFLIERLKLKLAGLFLIFLALLFLFIITNSISIPMLNGFLDLLPVYVASGLVIGIILGILIYVLLSFWQQAPLIIITLLALITPFALVTGIMWNHLEFSNGEAKNIEFSKKQIGGTIVFSLITLVCFVLAFIYFVKQKKITPQEVKKKIVYAPILVLLMFGAIAITVALFNHYRDQLLKLEEKIIEQRTISEDLDFADREFMPAIQIVGYYQAKKPEYLKIDIFDIDVINKNLVIESILDQYSYKNDISLRPSRLQTEAGKNIKVIYQASNDKVIPTAEMLLNLKNANNYRPLTVNQGLVTIWDTTLDTVNNDTVNQLEVCGMLAQGELTFTEYNYLNYQDLPLFSGINQYLLPYYYSHSDNVSITPDLERYQEIKELARDISKDARTDYDKAQALVDYFHQNYYYSLTPDIEDQANPIDDFILDTKNGYCTYFATSMTMMLEMLDIDARLVGGFYSDLYSDNLDAYLMLSSDLHAWVEVYINGYGWVTFDPTSPRCAADTNLCSIPEKPRNFSNSEPQEVAIILNSVDPQFTFKDIYDLRLIEELDFDDNGTSFDEMKKEWEEAQKQTKKNQEKQDKDTGDSFINLENIKQWINCIRKIVGWSLLVLSVVGALFWLYLKFKKIQYHRQAAHERFARKCLKKTKQYYLKKYALDSRLLALNNRQFLKVLKKKIAEKKITKQKSTKATILPAAVRTIFKITDKILYDKQCTREDLEELKRAMKEF